jgi:uncharacterized protein (DUF2147 family)
MRILTLLLGLLAFVSCSLLTLANAHAQNTGGDAVLGVWKNGEGTGLIQITKRGDKYYGKIVWLKIPNDPNGKPRVDEKNPDETLRSRPLKGMENMRDFIYNGKDKWEDGRIYDPKNGHDYACTMTLTNPNTLEVRGYVGISVFGRTDTWTRQVSKKK